MTISDIIRTNREKAGLSQKAVANDLGISQPAYALYEKGTKEPKTAIRMAIAEILGINPLLLLGTILSTDSEKRILLNYLHQYSDNISISDNKTITISFSDEYACFAELEEDLKKGIIGEREMKIFMDTFPRYAFDSEEKKKQIIQLLKSEVLHQRELEEAIKNTINFGMENNIPSDDIIKRLVTMYHLSESSAKEKLEAYIINSIF